MSKEEIALDQKIKELKTFIREKTDLGVANYLGKEIREICGMVEQLTSNTVSKEEILEKHIAKASKGKYGVKYSPSMKRAAISAMQEYKELINS